uniref:Uncharacterized protein n=1 Tax=Roseihalotalea indica TaxID=2867963 RepID=A0AA49JCM0_9BACT|nr:hypothetical protein K4G66_21155 [Tunicatimonas sp. TK19036]
MKKVTDIISKGYVTPWWLVMSVLLPALFFSTCPARVLDQLPQVSTTERVVQMPTAVRRTLSFQGALQKQRFSAFLAGLLSEPYCLLVQQSQSTVRLKSTVKDSRLRLIAQPLYRLSHLRPASADNQPPLLLG